MPSVQDEKPMVTNAIDAGGGADEPEEPRQPAPQRPSAAPHGFFTIYKKGQGKWTRLGTVFAGWMLAQEFLVGSDRVGSVCLAPVTLRRAASPESCRGGQHQTHPQSIHNGTPWASS